MSLKERRCDGFFYGLFMDVVALRELAVERVDRVLHTLTTAHCASASAQHLFHLQVRVPTGW